MIELIENKLDEIKAACKAHHVETISIFGSAAENALKEDSDLLVEFSENISVLEYEDNYFSLLSKL
ncbi:MAG: hypothetical protein JJU02_02755 [Cryomorphaceae bacterium]|nr:hypothetical protein [Cryomorphaceae bacterium]